ncbi:MAG: DUF1592 domain-containing protein [Pseudomonadota bacterium]
MTRLLTIVVLLAALTTLGCHSTPLAMSGNADGSGVGGAAPGQGSDAAAGARGGSGAAQSGTAGASGISQPGAAGSAGGSAGSPFVKPPAPGATQTPESAGTLALWHLTRSELENTLVDLLGASPAAVAAVVHGNYPADEIADTGYYAPATYSPLQTEVLMSIAEALAVPMQGTFVPPCTNPAPGADATACATAFIGSFGRRAFRRPLTDAEAGALLSLFNTATGLGFDFLGSLTQVVRGMLQSPNFLYHWEVGDATPARAGGLIALTQYQIASRLSYLLWQTMPDDTLLAAADTNQLSSPGQILTQATRMLSDPRAKAGLANFHRQWLRVNGVESIEENPALYPTFTPLEAQAFGTELSTFVSAVVSPGGDGTLKTLLTAPYTYQDNPAAAAIYGATPAAAAGDPVPLNPAQRAGVLTQAAFLAVNSQPLNTDPLARGLAVWRQFLCGPGDDSGHISYSLPVMIDPSLARRDQYAQFYAQQPMPSTCTGCHNSFDPLGFAFENYDMIGAYRTTDGGHAIDASGAMTTPGGMRIAFQNAVGLVNALADDDEVKWCVTRQWFRFVLGRLESPADQGSLELAYRAGAVVPGFSIREMLMSLVQTQTFRFRAPSPGEM